ncbi:MAG: TAT-variant-translocated molybdopterin oxidoreductase [Deltaproteobacteria bacterium]|nr:TAT-variant-translocated molybdopterin oxidoreductase [Deltaproteobacteria bacterium]
MSENHIEETAKNSKKPVIETDNNYWLSLENYYQDPEMKKLAETEFLSSPLREDKEEPWARREFLKLMGASLALSAASCVRRPVQKIIPYSKQPEEITLGVPNYYTSAYYDGQEVLGVLVKTREGRPIKLEGLSSYPLNEGGTSVRAQASILSLYDPDRLTSPKKNLFNESRTNKDTISIKWEDADKAIVSELKKGEVVLLTGNEASPSTKALIKDFSEAFKVKHVSWEPLSYEDIKLGQAKCYKSSLVPFYRFDKAKMIVSVDADFLGTWLMPTVFTKQFSKTRKDLAKMSRLVTFDSNYSLTGANSDIRIRIKPSQQLQVVVALIHEILVVQEKSFYAGNAAGNAKVKNWISQFSSSEGSSSGSLTQGLAVEPALIKEIAKDLWDNKGESLVVAGGISAHSRQSLELQVAVNFLNSLLENEGKTILSKPAVLTTQSSYTEMLDLIQEMKAKKVKTMIIHRSNPAFALSEKSEFISALKNVGLVVYIGDKMDEMAQHSQIVLPENHALETWGDFEAVSGLYSIQQPTLRPMYDTQSFQLTLMNWAFQAKQGPKRIQEFETFYDYLRNFWKTELYPVLGKGKTFQGFWEEALQKGSLGEIEGKSSSRSFELEALSLVQKSSLQASSVESSSASYEMVFYPTVQIGDGLNSNISWLHELPDPITKIVWDNYVSVSLATAIKLNAKEGQILELNVQGEKMELPLHIQPGLHDEVLAVAIGYGRTHGGEVTNHVGKNTYQLAKFEKNAILLTGSRVEAKVTNKKYVLAQTQTHHSMEGRQIVVEATLKEYQEKKSHLIHKHPIWSIWSGHQYNGHKWGMAIDLNSCTGCSACMVACQSENNIPVVGKKYVIEGREMHWIRIDRYFTGTPENAEVVFQPVMCQHCDNAPCETVCPVLATVHSSEGLNEMVYNRCVGTRYCSNNCPYKVRRFNWFAWTKKIEKPLHLALNPDVTVRVRGVMEKCTFCVQRIKEGKNKAKLEKRVLKDGEIKTACQTSCPTKAIVFGDMNNPESQVSKLFKNDRSYALLEEWHAAPSVRYMAKIRNNGKDAKVLNKTKPESDKGGHV